MCLVKQFCCGCTLRHGAITAAVFNAIAAVLMIAIGSQLIYVALYAKNDPEIAESVSRAFTIAGGIISAAGLVALVIFICLVIGIAKNIAGLVIPWLIGCMLNIILFGTTVIMDLTSGNFLSLIPLLVVSFYIYLWIVVFNYYKELRDGLPAYNQEIKLGPPPYSPEIKAGPPPYRLEIKA